MNHMPSKLEALGSHNIYGMTFLLYIDLFHGSLTPWLHV